MCNVLLLSLPLSLPLSVTWHAVCVCCVDAPAPGSIPASPPSKPFPVPYSDNFDSYPIDSEAAYFADQAGVWEIAASSNASRGMIMRQKVLQ